MNKERSRKTFRHGFLAFVSVCLFATSLMAVSAPANALLVLGSYVFIGPNGSARTYKIKNTAGEPKAYRLEWTQLQQMPVGAKRKMQKGEIVPGVMDAEPYMYIAPRRLMMQPNQLQHLRFMVRRAENMQPGEYRSYIYLQPEEIPATYKPNKDNRGTGGGKGASGTLSILTGYRIPVVFLHGDTTLQTGVRDVRFVPTEKGGTSVQFIFTREGTRSAIGEINIYCSTPEGEVRVSGGEIKVFTELNEKPMNYDLVNPPPNCAQVSIDFLPHMEDPDYARGPVRMAAIPMQ